MQKKTLNGLWQMSEVAKETVYPVTVPGTVLSCLVEQEAVIDPFYRKNEYAVRDLFWKDYQFERDFSVDKELLEEDVVELVCYSLDTFAEIYIGGKLLAKTDNMHRTWHFSVKDYLKVGENHITIIFRSALQYAKDYKTAENKPIYYESPVTTKGNEFIRKAHSMFGWDWGAQLVDAGIQRDIELIAYSQAKLEDVVITQEHKDGQVSLDVAIKSAVWEGSGQIEVELKAPDGRKSKILSKTQWPEEKEKQEMTRLSDGRFVPIHLAKAIFQVENPQLWWPNGYGEHPLYEVVVTLIKEGGQKEVQSYTIGLRTLTVSQEKDQWGSEFAFCINGVKIFAMGANYIPEDCIYPRITREKIESLIKASVRANYNCLRHWGGGYYPSDYFYELCDQYGLIVWQDLMFACNVYEFTEEFEKNVIEEIKDNVKRLRHHACLGMWCGNNELESGWHHWTDFICHNEYLKADYIRQFEHVLPRVVQEMDSQTFYWRSSPSSGGCIDDPDDENRGDEHYWAVWHGQLPFTDYRKHYFRFCSEFGFQSFPCTKTVYTYTEPEDRNIFSDVMESHQKNSSANGKMLYYLAENFRYPKDFESLLYVTQVLQALAMKFGVEHWRRNRGRCMGALYWQLNDNWPVASWSSIDYYGRWKALHYFAKNFYAPITGSVESSDYKVRAYVANETLKEAEYEVEVALKTLDFKVIRSQKTRGVIDRLSSKEVLAFDFTADMENYNPQEVFCAVTYIHGDGRIQRETEVFVPYKHMNLRKPQIKTQVKDMGDAYEISLYADTFVNYTALDFADVDAIFSDNFVAISGEGPVVIRLNKEDITGGTFTDAEDLQKRLMVKNINDSY